MENVAVAEKLASSEELDELYKLNATETEPEPEPEPEEGEGDEADDEEGTGIRPHEMPHE